MGLHADAVAGAVDEVLAETGFVDDPTRRLVDTFTRSADGAGRNTSGLRGHQRLVEICEFGRWLAGVDAAGDVGAVVGHGAAEVAQHHLVGLDHPPARLVVWAGGILPGRDDREVHELVTLSKYARRQIRRYFRLGPADQRDVTVLQLGGDDVDGRRGILQRFDLGGVLHGPQRTRDMRRLTPRRLRQQGLQIEQERRPASIADAEHGPLADQVGHDLHRRLGLAPRTHVEQLGHLLHPGRLHAGHDQGRCVIDR